MKRAEESNVSVSGPLGRPKSARLRTFATAGTSVFGNYLSSRNGGDTGHAECFHLLSPNKKAIGFISVSAVIDVEVDCAIVAVNYVFIKEQFRLRGLSRVLVGHAEQYFIDYLRRAHGKFEKVLSISNTKTDAGRYFIKSLDGKLRKYCRSVGASFSPTVRC